MSDLKILDCFAEIIRKMHLINERFVALFGQLKALKIHLDVMIT